MQQSVIPISNFQLALTVLLVMFTGGISYLLKLGLLKNLLWGTVRTFVQLTLVGYALTYIFYINNIWLVIAVVTLMCYVAARTAVKRIPDVDSNLTLLAFFSLLSSTYLVGAIVTELIIAPKPWYSARIIIPIFGMILGNSMNGIALALDRLYGEARSRAAEIEALLSFGATPWEAVRSSVQISLRSGMLPTINSMMVVGLVSLPGMMTGQILGGADPREAVRYQIVVQLMVAATVAIGSLIMVGLSYKKLFNKDGALQPFVLQSQK